MLVQAELLPTVLIWSKRRLSQLSLSPLGSGSILDECPLAKWGQVAVNAVCCLKLFLDLFDRSNSIFAKNISVEYLSS